MLGVIGGLVLVLIVVFVTVPLLRSRLYGKPRRAPSEKTQSRASSRRTHIRIPSGREVVEPLLDGQGKHLSVTGQWHGADRKDVEVRNGKKPDRGGMDEKAGASKLSPDTPIRPPSAVFNWKILTTLPNFSDESLSSLGEPLEPGASKQPKASTSASNPPPPPPKQDVPTLEIITATNTTASTSRQSHARCWREVHRSSGHQPRPPLTRCHFAVDARVQRACVVFRIHQHLGSKHFPLSFTFPFDCHSRRLLIRSS